jgi:hypothetical protein
MEFEQFAIYQNYIEEIMKVDLYMEKVSTLNRRTLLTGAGEPGKG